MVQIGTRSKAAIVTTSVPDNIPHIADVPRETEFVRSVQAEACDLCRHHKGESLTALEEVRVNAATRDYLTRIKQAALRLREAAPISVEAYHGNVRRAFVP